MPPEPPTPKVASENKTMVMAPGREEFQSCSRVEQWGSNCWGAGEPISLRWGFCNPRTNREVFFSTVEMVMKTFEEKVEHVLSLEREKGDKEGTCQAILNVLKDARRRKENISSSSPASSEQQHRTERSGGQQSVSQSNVRQSFCSDGLDQHKLAAC